MPLTLVTGPANAAKAGYVLERLREVLHREPLLVVPTAADVAHYQRELAAGGVVFGAQVLTFSRLVRELGRVAGVGARPLGPVARERVVRAAIADARLRVLAPSAAAPGFAAAAGALFAELQRSLVEPARFTRALRSWGGVPYADELAALYSAYRRRLEALGRPDREGEAWAALDALRADPAAWGRRPVFLYGFDELTRAQLDAVETLSRLAEADVWVTLPYEPGRHALAGSAATVQELAPLADVVELPERAEHYAGAARPALHHLERGLFEAGAERRAPNGAVRLLEAGGERAEAEIVGAEVLELMRDGVAAEDIAVLVRGSGTAALFAQVLGTYGIPVGVVAAGAAGADAARRRRARGRAGGAAGRARRGPAGVAADAAGDRGRHAPRDGDGSSAARRAPTPSTRSTRGCGATRSPARARRREAGARGRCRGSTRSPPRRRPGRRRCSTRSSPRPRRPGPPRTRAAPTCSPAEERDEARVAAELRVRRGRAARARPGAARRRGGAARRARRGRGAPGRRRPTACCSPTRSTSARAASAPCSCAGCRTASSPSGPVPEPFLDDEARRALSVAAGLRLPFHEDVLDRERSLFYACVSRPQEVLFLSWRSSDEEGEPLVASPFLDDVRALFTDELWEQRGRRLLAEVTWSPREAPTPRELQRAQAQARNEPDPPPLPAPVSAPVLAQLAARRTEGARQLETFAACGVRWLVEALLHPSA